MAGYTQNNRILAFQTPLGANTLLAMTFEGAEGISELFRYTVDVVTEVGNSIIPASIVGKRVTMELQVTDTGTKRYFNGIVASFESTGGDAFFNSYRVFMVPMLWLLSLNQQTRVFQDLSVLEIARQVLEPYSIAPQLQVQESYPTLEYCTQYRETDLQFLERILQQQGIFYYFHHSASDHVLVLSDTSALCSDCEVTSTLDYAVAQERKLSFYQPMIQAFTFRSALIPGEHSAWDYRFIQYAASHGEPGTLRSAQQMGDNSHEYYDFADSAAAFLKTEGADGKTVEVQSLLQKVQRDMHDARAVICEGESTASTLQAGFSFTLQKYPQQEKNMKYLVTRVNHRVQQQPGYRSEVSRGEEDPYHNQFEARPFQQIYRSAKKHSKPRVQGVVTGKVVTYPGEDSYLDRFGRVCVQFWWDRLRASDTPDKTLLRVTQQWAGKGWGTYFWPRIGDEVLIDFIEGDPDAPIVVGSVYNGVNLPKYDPKTQYTRSGILTRSSQGGSSSNANELRFEDRKGAEQIFLNAERDMDLRTERDHRRYVGGGDHLIVRQNRLVQVDGDLDTEIKGSRVERVADRADLDVALSRTERTGAGYGLNVGTEFAVRVGENYNLQASALCSLQGTAGVHLESETMITLKVGATSLTVTPAGVIVNGELIPLPATLGAAVPPIPLIIEAPAVPTTPDVADDGSSGGKL